MTPRDWNEMKKLLGDVAKGNDVQEVLEKVLQGVEVNFRSPVSIKAFGNTDGTAVSGTGKGILFLRLIQDTQTTLTIDGVKFTYTYKGASVGNYFVEFTSSFSFKNTSGKWTDGIAVFY